MPLSTFSRSGVDLFWGEIPPCEHIVELYSDEAHFLQLLVGFVAGGLAAGESVVLLATREHLQALEATLADRDIDIAGARRRDHYLSFEVDDALQRIMRGDWPDEARFEAFVSELLERGSAGGRRVRAFGELVAVLWARGHQEATIELEKLWDRLCRRHGLPLFCAYPRAGFRQEHGESVREICKAHTRVLHA